MLEPTTTTLELRDAAPPDGLIPGHSLGWWWAMGAAAIVAAILLAWWLKRRKPAAPHPTKIRQQAWQEADKALAQISANDPRDAAVQSSLIVRKYLSLAAQDPALFETHEEFIARHDSLTALTPAARAAASDGFARLAALKYAPVPPDADAAAILTESRGLLRVLHQGFAA